MFKKPIVLWLILGCLVSTASYGQETAPTGGTQATGAGAPAKHKPPSPRFDIWEYRVSGNTLLKRKLVERTIYPFLGPGKTLQDIERARAALEKRYHEVGYATVLVTIPQQEVNNGVVRLKVTEGKVDRVLVTGSRYFSLQRIRSEVPALAEGKVPYLPEVQVQLVALDKETSDRAITPVLRPGRTPGTVEVELRVKDQLPLHGSVELNDQNSVDTTRLRLSGMLRYDNLWQKEHSLSLQYQTSPENTKEVQVWAATYLARFAMSDNLLAFYGVHSDSNTATVGTLAVIGKGDIFGVRGIIPLESTQHYFQTLTLGVDYKDFKESVVLLGADTVNRPINYVPFTVQYNGTILSQRAQTKFGVSLNFGIRGLGNDPRKFDLKRVNSRPDYLYLRTNLERDQDLYRGFGVNIKLDGQISDAPLISSEEFSAGGVDSVRGYHEAERLGDDGIQGSVEFLSPSLTRGRLAAQVQEWRAYLFWDSAALRVRDPLGGQASNFELASAGFGFRLKAWRHLDASLAWAQVFHGTESVNDDGQRIHFDLEYSF